MPTPTASAPSSRNVPTGLLAVASALSVANVYYAQPLLDGLAAEFGIGTGAIGGVVTATQLGCALALLLVVPVGDQVNRRRLLLIQAALLVAALAGVGLAWGAIPLLAGMVAVGLLGTAMTQGLIAFAASTARPEERGRVVGATQSGVVIGLLLARVIAGTLADLVGWRGVYLISALLMAFLAILLWRRLPDQAAAQAPLPYPRLILSMWSLLRSERVLQIRGMLALLMFAAFSIFWSALVLPLSAPPHNLSHTAVGAFGLVGLVGALAAARAGRWADRGQAQCATGAALAILLLAWLPLGFGTHSLWALVVGVILLDLGGQAIHVLNQTLILAANPNAHGRLIGGYMLFYAVGSGLGGIAATTAYARAGWTGVCLLGAGVSAAALLFWALTLRHMPGRAACRLAPRSCKARNARPATMTR